MYVKIAGGSSFSFGTNANFSSSVSMDRVEVCNSNSAFGPGFLVFANQDGPSPFHFNGSENVFNSTLTVDIKNSNFHDNGPYAVRFF